MELPNSTERHLLSILKLWELLNDSIKLANFRRLARQTQIFYLESLISPIEQFFQFEVVCLNLHQLVLVLVIVCSDGLKTLLQTFDLLPQIFKFFLKVSDISFLRGQHFLACSEITTDLFFVVLQELDLFPVWTGLSFFVTDDFVVRLSVGLEFLNLSYCLFKSWIKLLSFLLKFEYLASLVCIFRLKHCSHDFRLRWVSFGYIQVCGKLEQCEIVLQMLPNMLRWSIHHKQVSDLCLGALFRVGCSSVIEKWVSSRRIHHYSPSDGLICIHQDWLRKTIQHISSDLTPCLLAANIFTRLDNFEIHHRMLSDPFCPVFFGPVRDCSFWKFKHLSQLHKWNVLIDIEVKKMVDLGARATNNPEPEQVRLILLNHKSVNVRSGFALERAQQLLIPLVLHFIELFLGCLHWDLSNFDTISIKTIDKAFFEVILFVGNAVLICLTIYERLIHLVLVMQRRHCFCRWSISMSKELLHLICPRFLMLLKCRFVLLIDSLALFITLLTLLPFRANLLVGCPLFKSLEYMLVVILAETLSWDSLFLLLHQMRLGIFHWSVSIVWLGLSHGCSEWTSKKSIMITIGKELKEVRGLFVYLHFFMGN